MSKPESEETVRTFLAIELPSSLKADLGWLESSFAEHASILRVSAPELLHITVKFLGGVPVGRLAAVGEAAAEAAARTSPFRLTLAGVGAFPNVRSPRVIWVGLEQDNGYREMQQLFTNVEAALAEQGFPRETRPFSPHITLARTRDRISAGERTALGLTVQRRQRDNGARGSWDVHELVVMRSDLGRSGPRYTALATLPLSRGSEGRG